MRILRVCLCVLVMLCAWSGRASAQFDSAVVLGTVRDGSGAVVPGAGITLRNVETGLTSSAVTDSNGSYQFLNVRIGTVRSDRRTGRLLDRRGEGRGRGDQRTPARRPDAAGGGAHRRGDGDVGGAAARDRFERTRPGDRARADRQPAAQRPVVFQPGAALERACWSRTRTASAPAAARARSTPTASATRRTTSSSMASTTTPTAPATRASPTR